MKKNHKKPTIYTGDVGVDQRGTVRFVNSFGFEKVKRFYQVENFDTKTIRAFHGHMKEEKFVYVTKGAILLCLVPLDNQKTPSKDTPVEQYVLSADKPRILHIPAKYANGFKALTTDTSVIFFSNTPLEQAKTDDYRFPYDYWGKDIWEVKHW